MKWGGVGWGGVGFTAPKIMYSNKTVPAWMPFLAHNMMQYV
jgi:hypothetical protein